jgi:hypothetical protein
MAALRDELRGINDRLDIVNGRTRTMEQKVAVLEDRSTPGRREGAIAGGIGAGLVGLAAVIKEWVW